MEGIHMTNNKMFKTKKNKFQTCKFLMSIVLLTIGIDDNSSKTRSLKRQTNVKHIKMTKNECIMQCKRFFVLPFFFCFKRNNKMKESCYY